MTGNSSVRYYSISFVYHSFSCNHAVSRGDASMDVRGFLTPSIIGRVVGGSKTDFVSLGSEEKTFEEISVRDHFIGYP